MRLSKLPHLNRIFVILIIFFSLWIISVMLPSSGKAAVTLVYFKAIPESAKVYFEWKTASEQNNAGFVINKLKDGGDYSNVNDYLPLQYTEGEDFYPAQEEGDVYYAEYYNDDSDYVRYYDEDVTDGVTYWYRLESVDNSNNSVYSDPVSVFIGSTPTPTVTNTSQAGQATSTPTATQAAGVTSTNTATSTVTPTKTKSSTTKKTATPQRTATTTTSSAGTFPTATTQSQPPNNNPPPGDQQATAVAQTNEAAQQIISPEVQATATLIPLPSITMVFPTAMGNRPADDAANVTDNAPKTNSASWLTPQRMVVVFVIASIWIMLGGWFYLSFKRLEK